MVSSPAVQRAGDGGESRGQLGVVGLAGQFLGPELGQVEVAAAVVQLAGLALRGLVLQQEGAGGAVQGVGQDLRAGVARGRGEVLEADGEGQELAQAVPAQVVFLEQLLDVLRGGAAGAGFEEAAAVDQRNHGEHLGAGAEFQDREQVREVVAQHVAGHRDGVLALADPLQREGRGLLRGHDGDLQALGVVVLEVFLDLGDHLGVVGAALVQPEDGRRGGGAGAGDGQLDPVADRDVLGLAGAPDVARGDLVFDQHGAGVVDQLDGAGGLDLEGLVVAAVFLGGLGHQADVRDGAHGGRVEGAVGAAVVDDHLVDAGVAAVREDGERVGFLAVAAPHVAGAADHGRHGGVHDHVGGDVQVGDALVGIDHGQLGAVVRGPSGWRPRRRRGSPRGGPRGR